MTNMDRAPLAPLDRWRNHLLGQGTAPEHVADLEERLRAHADTLEATLDPQEAFLVALKRVAAHDPGSRDFARTYAAGLWAAPAATEAAPEISTRGATIEFLVMLACAVAAALAVKLPVLFGYDFDGPDDGIYARNLSLFVLPMVAAYFVWKKGAGKGLLGSLVGLFAAGALAVNAYPFIGGGSTETLAAIHLPIVLWLVVGVAYVAGRWREDAPRMEFVRFTGEWVVNFALIGLGGGVLVGLTMGVFQAIGIDAEPFVEDWILSCAAGAVVVASWLVVTRRRLVAGMAPMLARVFTPLFTLMLVALLAGVISTGGAVDMGREVLILFDLLLVVVLALLLYGISSRDPHAAPGLFDRVQLVLVGCALAVDVFALINIAGRLTEYGWSANRAAALGLNLLLLVNLAWSAVLQAKFLASRTGFGRVERWQMRYLPAYALWAAIVVVVFPPLFGFV